jgi:hypothetical protein
MWAENEVYRARIAELEAELAEAKSVGDWNRKMLAAERDRLKAALQALYDDCAEYITINHLYGKDGQSALANQVMEIARAALSDPSGEKP